MASLNQVINTKNRCSSCLKIIQKKGRMLNCLTCGTYFHAVPCCVKSHDINTTLEMSINTCQNCITDSLPFQTLDDLDFELTLLKGNNLSEQDMDRLKSLKFNPFETDRNIALIKQNQNLNNLSNINCDYYLPSDFRTLVNNESHKIIFH